MRILIITKELHIFWGSLSGSWPEALCPTWPLSAPLGLWYNFFSTINGNKLIQYPIRANSKGMLTYKCFLFWLYVSMFKSKVQRLFTSQFHVVSRCFTLSSTINPSFSGTLCMIESSKLSSGHSRLLGLKDQYDFIRINC